MAWKQLLKPLHYTEPQNPNVQLRPTPHIKWSRVKIELSVMDECDIISTADSNVNWAANNYVLVIICANLLSAYHLELCEASASELV